MRRRPSEELLDSDSGTPAEIAASLRDLRRINRFGGGITNSAFLLRTAMRSTGMQRASVLEIAAADGYSIRKAVERIRHEGLDCDLTLLDRSSRHLRDEARSTAVIGDALAPPFADESFDFVSCALFVHHLSPDEARRFFREALRVARRAVLVNDLRRSRVHLWFVYLGLPAFSRITRHDAVASVRQAYTPGEMRTMLQDAGAARVEVRDTFFFRMAAIGWKR